VPDDVRTLNGARSLYESDEHAWIAEQVAALRAGDWDSLDRANLIEFLNDMAGRDRRELESRLKVLLHPLLKARHQPESLNGSLVMTIIEQQGEIRSILKGLPSLARQAQGIAPACYPDAVRRGKRAPRPASFPPLRLGRSRRPWPSIRRNPRRASRAERRPTVIRAALILLLTGATARAATLPPVESTAGLVVSAQHLAAEAGAAILRQGGNAIDAAVAAGYAEAVVNPCCGNIGGGGFMTAHLDDGRDIFLNFRETAPAAASRDMYLDPSGNVIRGASLFGWKAVGVPGTVLGFDTALAKYGTMPRGAVMAAAIRLARDGFVLDDADASILARGARLLRQDAQAAAIFLHTDGTPYRTGERLVQPDLARTLEAIADRGADAFYAGEIPAAVEAGARLGGGIITAADFAAYRVTEAAPLACTYRGHVVLSAPPPSSGGTTLCETLNILEAYDLRGMGLHAAESVHLMTEALRLAFFDRNTWLGDPAFVSNPLNRLLSKEYAARLRGMIGDCAAPSAGLQAAVADEKQETTHFSVLDSHGGAAAVTYTINGGFGAGVVGGGTGFLLNDEMDDFTLKPNVPNQFGLVQGAANAIAPGKRPLSSMAPTLVTKDGAVEMVLGSPGGSRIITVVLQTILNVIDYGMNPQEAVDAPRLHHQMLPDVLYAEPYALSPDTQALLERMGYRIQEQPPWGAAALIASGTMMPAPRTGAAPDSVASSARRPGAYYGAMDARRPAGAALVP
jgi:gamma-glutamyltranspeptidase/glutathione hydrolase